MTLSNITINIKCVDNFSKPLFDAMYKTFFWGLPLNIKESILKAFED